MSKYGALVMKFDEINNRPVGTSDSEYSVRQLAPTPTCDAIKTAQAA